MTPLALTHDLTHDQNPYVGDLAARIVRSFNSQSKREESHRWALVEKVLTFAAEAEQRIAEQQARIAYLETLSNTDELTGLANRRGLEGFLKRTMALSKRHGEQGVVAFVDLDDFKQVNDKYGHEAGDKLLRRMADLLTQNVRLSDYVARLGGDEFVVVLIKADREQGKEHIERLREIINSTSITFAGRRIRLKASIGLACYGPDCEPGDILSRADRAMYADKAKRQEDPAGR
jgi:diguanylate cyclase (GGDEF)-like protein